MPITWNAESEAKLFRGMITQVKSANLKLDYGQLAAYMGSDCSTSAVQQYINKLHRESKGASAGGDETGSAAAQDGSPAAKKRKSAGGAKKGAAKKVKGGATTPAVAASVEGDDAGNKKEE